MTAFGRRYYDPSLLFEVTMRTIDGVLRFDPQNPLQVRRIIGAFGAAQRETKVAIHAFHFLGNHYHGLYSAPSPHAMAQFLCLLHAELARIANEDAKRRGPIWSYRAHVVPIVADEIAQLRRVRYVMAQAVKAGFVSHPSQYPGASSLPWQLTGAPMVGLRVDRTRRSLDGRKKDGIAADAHYAHEVPLAVSPLPALGHLPVDAVHAIYNVIADDLAAEFTNRTPNGVCAAGSAPVALAEYGPDEEYEEDHKLETELAADERGSRDASDPAGFVAATKAVERPSTAAKKASGPRPHPARNRAKAVHARTRAQYERYCQARLAFDEACVEARRLLEKEAAKAQMGGPAKFIAFPPLAFPCPAPAASCACSLVGSHQANLHSE